MNNQRRCSCVGTVIGQSRDNAIVAAQLAPVIESVLARSPDQVKHRGSVVSVARVRCRGRRVTSSECSVDGFVRCRENDNHASPVCFDPGHR